MTTLLECMYLVYASRNIFYTVIINVYFYCLLIDLSYANATIGNRLLVPKNVKVDYQLIVFRVRRNKILSCMHHFFWMWYWWCRSLHGLNTRLPMVVCIITTVTRNSHHGINLMSWRHLQRFVSNDFGLLVHLYVELLDFFNLKQLSW